MTDEFHQQITDLVTAACRHNPNSPERRRYLTQIIRLIYKSNKLWRESTPYYEDALQQTWIYFCLNICEANTAQEAYNPNKSQITTWLNNYLRRRLQDLAKEHNQVKVNYTTSAGDSLDIIEMLPSPPDIPPILQQVQEWVETDPEGELRSLHIKGRKDITAQVLLLRRLPPETSWKDIAEEFGVGISTLSSFYQRHCFPLLRNFGKKLGYLE